MPSPGWVQDVLLWIIGALAAFGAWMVRRIFTNQQEIALVKQSLDDLRYEMEGVKESNTELIDLIKVLIKK